MSYNYDSVQYFKILYQEEIYKKLYIYITLSLANEFFKSLKFEVRTKSASEFHSGVIRKRVKAISSSFR